MDPPLFTGQLSIVTPVRKSALIIDEYRTSRRELVSIIEELELSIEYVSNSMNALNSLRSRRHDLVIVNLDTTFLPMIRDEILQRSSNVISVATYNDQLPLSTLDNHFLRPFRPESLQHRICTLLSL
jgi:CheY-like chemotaxis protein